MNVVILAAGKGSRMKSDLPKVLHRIAGEPMVARVVRTALAAGGSQLICVVGHGAEQVTQSLQRMGLATLEFVTQDPPQGTGHAVHCALPALSKSPMTLVLYGDVPLTRPETLASLVQAAQAADQMAVLTAELQDPTGYGRILRSPDHAWVVGCVEEKDASPAQKAITEVNTGILVAPTEALHRWIPALGNQNAQGEYYLTDILAMAAAEGLRVAGLSCPDPMETLGVNSPAQRAALERALQLRIAEDLMAQGVTLADPSRIDVRGELVCGRDVEIDVGCVFEGRVVLASGVKVGPNCVLKSVEVGEGSRIEAMSHLEQAVVGPRAVVGPFARLRPGTRMEEGSHVGNFVELKACELGPYSKANHLSYLGDASIGARVNIGAGTITCNYDGAEKHRTVIEDDVFIGSDSQLVAPVTVHQGATLAAGTTLTSDAPADQLTLSRTRQTSIARWKRPKKQAH